MPHAQAWRTLFIATAVPDVFPPPFLPLAGECDAAKNPIQPKRTSPEFLRSVPHLRMRTQLYAAHARVRSAAVFATHRFFEGLGFLNINTPILTGNDCEGAGEAFRALAPSEVAALRSGGGQSEARAPHGSTAPDAPGAVGDASAPPLHFLGQPMHLTVSGQLHAEAAALAYPRVYTFGAQSVADGCVVFLARGSLLARMLRAPTCFCPLSRPSGPTFRAENSNTPRHLSEFYMLEAEMSFAVRASGRKHAIFLPFARTRRILIHCHTPMARMPA